MNRSMKEIQKDIDDCYECCQDLRKEGYSTQTNSWKSREYVDDMNLLYRHIRNLQLELNRARHREFGKEVREKRQAEKMKIVSR